MRLLKQNKPQCLLHAAAMILDVDPKILIDEIGHNGMERVWKDLHMPACLRGFHIQEIIDCCRRRHLGLMPIEVLPRSGPQDNLRIWRTVFSHKQAQRRFITAIEGQTAILIGQFKKSNHAVAWDGKEVYDPNGIKYSLEKFAVKEAWILLQCSVST